jgi:hypothetical protein
MDDALRDRAASWYHREHFGFTKPPPELDLRAMAIALVTVANGDRQVTPDERNWIVGYFAAKGYSPIVVRDAMAAAPIDLRAIPELMQTGTLRRSARILVYDAIRVAAVDGYHPGRTKRYARSPSPSASTSRRSPTSRRWFARKRRSARAASPCSCRKDTPTSIRGSPARRERIPGLAGDTAAVSERAPPPRSRAGSRWAHPSRTCLVPRRL